MALLLLLLLSPWMDAVLSGTGATPAVVDYQLVDFHSGEVLDEKWNNQAPTSPGSLLKPFVVLAYARVSGQSFPSLHCSGETCWLPSGHGAIGVEQAIAQSCNTYMRRLAESLSALQVQREASRLGVPPPPSDSSAEAFWGLRPDWVLAPQDLLRGYAELIRRRAEPGPSIVLRGLRQAARSGTASAFDRRLPGDALAKTGTAECAHDHRADGDGFSIAAYPADAPRYAILVRVHGRTGRVAAAVAAAILADRLGP